jgi:hypothetical protein
METVERLTPLVRSRAKYGTSLQVLRRAKHLAPSVVTKSGVMLGLGEKETELFQTMDDLREVGCEVLTMGQYLRRLRNIYPWSSTSRPSNSITTATLRAEKGFSMSPLAHWSAALITRPTFIRYRGDDKDRARSARSDSFANRRGHSCVSGSKTHRGHRSPNPRAARSVLVVDDGSSDQTAQRRAKRAQKSLFTIKIAAKAKRSKQG